MEDVADVHTRQSVVNEQRIRRVRPNRKMNQVHLLHDNARPHTSLHTRDELATVVWTDVHHPPDLAWSDFHFIGHLKDGPRGRTGHPFVEDDELKHSVREELQHFSQVPRTRHKDSHAKVEKVCSQCRRICRYISSALYRMYQSHMQFHYNYNHSG